MKKPETHFERQRRLQQSLVWSAEKMDTALVRCGKDAVEEAILTLRMFRESEIIVGLWPDRRSPGGYGRTVMKGPANPFAAVRVAAMFRESEEHARLTGELYGLLNDDYRDDGGRAWDHWVDITPANVKATKARLGKAWMTAHRA
ncbi:hypothetical protein AU375_03983 [Methylobacterium radiotolerans]|nr:hypothetical protein AU375_03983 [Methylobacterium radiotolerans]